MTQSRDRQAAVWRDYKGRPFYKMPLIKSGGQEWLPGVHSASVEDNVYRKALVERLEEYCPPDNKENGEPGDNFIHTSWRKLLAKPGFDQTPISYVPLTNEGIVEDLGLHFGPWSPRDVAIFDKVFELALAKWKEGSFRAKNNSSMGFPTFETDGTVKRECAETWLRNRHKVFKLFDKRDMWGLFKDHNALFAYMMQVRRQTDDPAKVRRAATYEAVVAGLDTLVETNKEVWFEQVHYEEFGRMRARPVQGLSWFCNTFIQAMASGHMRFLFDEYAYTFKHTTKEQVCAKLDATFDELEPLYGEVDTLFSDVSDYDRTIRGWMFDRFHVKLSEVYDQSIADFSHLAQRAPYFMRPNSVDVRTGEVNVQGHWIGNPFVVDTFKVDSGLRSGIGWVSFLGKVIKFAESACVWDRVTGDVLEDCANYMLGRRALRQLNSGDDTIEVGPKAMIAKVKQLRASMEGGYFKIEPEQGQGFIGSLYRRENRKWRAEPRIVTMVEKLVCHEHDINHAFRAHWPIGVYERVMFYGSCPAYDAVSAAMRDVWKEHLEPTHGSFDGLVSRSYLEMQRRFGIVTAESAADLTVMLNRDALHYKVEESEVSEKVLETISTRIDEKLTFDFIGERYNGRIY